MPPATGRDSGQVRIRWAAFSQHIDELSRRLKPEDTRSRLFRTSLRDFCAYKEVADRY